MTDHDPNGSTEPAEPISLRRDDRAFRIEFEASPYTTGWLLREQHHTGWPTMAGPFATLDEAAGDIEELIASGPLCCFQDEHGFQSCWI